LTDWRVCGKSAAQLTSYNGRFASNSPLKNVTNEAFFSVWGWFLGWGIWEFEVC
jgi:hypothetical protein